MGNGGWGYELVPHPPFLTRHSCCKHRKHCIFISRPSPYPTSSPHTLKTQACCPHSHPSLLIALPLLLLSHFLLQTPTLLFFSQFFSHPPPFPPFLNILMGLSLSSIFNANIAGTTLPLPHALKLILILYSLNIPQSPNFAPLWLPPFLLCSVF